MASAAQTDPTAAGAVFMAEGTSTGPVSTTISVGRHTIHTDEPANLGGKNHAPNPVQYALVALVSCQLLSFRFWAAQLGVQVDDLDVSIEARLDSRGFFGLDEHTRPGFAEVTMAVQVSGPETPERYAEAQVAVEARDQSRRHGHRRGGAFDSLFVARVRSRLRPAWRGTPSGSAPRRYS